MGAGVTLEVGPSLEEVWLGEELLGVDEVLCVADVFSDVCEEEVFSPSELDGAGALEEVVVCDEETSLVKTGADEELCPPEEPQETSASKARTENGISFFIWNPPVVFKAFYQTWRTCVWAEGSFWAIISQCFGLRG